MNKESLKPLSITFALSAVWDIIAGFLYIFYIGTGRKINNPPIDPFFAIFLGSFFLCFAFIQFMSAFNIRRYTFNVGCLILGRAFYVIQLYTFMGFVNNFPSTFWFTGIIDSVFILLYIVFAVKGGLSAKDLFFPKRVHT